MCRLSQFTFLEELSCQQWMPGRFWAWFVSPGHPELLIPAAEMKYKNQNQCYCGRGPTKSNADLHSDLDIIMWIKFVIFIQISPAIDQ